MGVKQLVFSAERLIGRCFYHRHTWLISDRKMTAGDNGEAFFRFLQDKDVDAVFAISKSSDDFKRLEKIGKVVDYDSPKYKFLLCAADCHCSSQLIHMENHKETPQVFLQHGVSFDNISSMMKDAAHNNLYTVTSSEMEAGEILDAPKDYLDKHIWLTGMPRFDYLKNNPQKKIVIAFTWRYPLGSMAEEEIIESVYFKNLFRIMRDDELHNELSKRGYELYIKLHPEMERFRKLIEETSNCLIYNENYQTMYEEASVMITDFSSSVADFAYLHKPVIYYQFDKNVYFEETPFKNKGRFDYSEDGFGPLVDNYTDFTKALLDILDNDCVMSDKYSKRVDSYYKYTDRNNCDRVYKKICDLLGR